MYLELVEVWSSMAEREAGGSGMQNFNYPPIFDEICHELACTRPEAYRTFQRAFGGRSERNFLVKRSAMPLFQQGITATTHEHAVRYVKELNYPLNGPVALSVDDSKVHKALTPEYNKETGKHYLVGTEGQAYEVADINALEDDIARAQELQADKLRLWVLQIPLPNVPPLMLAAVPISNMSAQELCDLEKRILDVLIGGPDALRIVSLGSDGTVTERDARRLLTRSGYARFPEERSSTRMRMAIQ